MRLLVTGGAGYIGSHFCRHAVAHGHEVAVIDDLSRGFAAALPSTINLFRFRIHSVNEVRDLVRSFKPNALLHFAAFANVAESVTQPQLYEENNVAGTHALLKALTEHPLPIVFSSTCAVYGNPDRVPVTEAAVRAPLSPYGTSKATCEDLLQGYAKQANQAVLSLRYFNACGASLDGAHGEASDPPARLIPAIFDALKKGREFKVFGADYDTPDGTCVRDYIHVEDLARAHLLAAEYVMTGSHYAALNLGSGHGHSNLEVLQALETQLGHRIPYMMAPRRPGDPARLYADPGAAKELLGFSAQYSDLETIASTSAQWHLNHPNGYRPDQ